MLECQQQGSVWPFDLRGAAAVSDPKIKDRKRYVAYADFVFNADLADELRPKKIIPDPRQKELI